MRRLIALFALCLAFGASAAPATVDAVLAHLATHRAVRADFTQTRENPALAEPQVSRGDLLFVVGHGMLWHTRTPYDDTLVFTAGGTSRADAEGRLQRVRDANRGVSQVTAMLQSLLAGRSDEAARQFDIAAEGDPDHWTLRFTPRQSRMAKVLQGIVLTGGEFLEGIDVNMANGERTRIDFARTRDAGTPGPIEAKLLGLP